MLMWFKVAFTENNFKENVKTREAHVYTLLEVKSNCLMYF